MTPDTRYIFHLSIPVADLQASKRFYVEALGATVGRENAQWLDILLWGHQVTLQNRPGDVMPRSAQGKRHFGVVLPWNEWEALAASLQRTGVPLLGSPSVEHAGTPNEQAKLYLEDPSHNLIEVKAYRDIAGTLGTSDAGYRTTAGT